MPDALQEAALGNRPLRVLQVCSASRATYGAVQSLMTLTQEQRAAGHEVEFLTFKGKSFGGYVRERQFPVHEVQVRAKIDPKAILQMRRIIKARGYDVVHTHLSTSSVNGCLAAKVAKVPSIATVHGMSGKLSFAAADHLIAVSDQVKQHLVSQGVRSDRISVVYNGLDLSVPPMERSEARRILGLPNVFPILGTVARVTATKAVDDGLRAVASLVGDYPDLVYVIVGEGDALSGCKALAKELGIQHHVRFAGYQRDVMTYLAAMDLFLFPSLKEAMGIALVEAMAAGLPTVSTDVGGIPEVITSDCGLLVPPRSPDALAEGARRLLANRDRRTSMAIAARERARTVFSADAMQRSTDWVYRALLGQSFPLPAERPGHRQRV